MTIKCDKLICIDVTDTLISIYNKLLIHHTDKVATYNRDVMICNIVRRLLQDTLGYILVDINVKYLSEGIIDSKLWDDDVYTMLPNVLPLDLNKIYYVDILTTSGKLFIKMEEVN